jgi:multidrug efflux pump subunit AcrA (membrane-fusion protein)
MRFLFRAFGGLLLLVLAASLLGIASVKLKNAFSEKAEGSFKKKYGNERIYTAYVERLKPTQISPKIMAYGEAKSWRSLELRAASSGRLIFLSKNFREGGMISAGETLFKIDPREAEDLVKVADVNRLEARAEYNEAQSALSLVQSDLSYSEEQLKLRLTAVERQKKFKCQWNSYDGSCREQ